MMIPSLIHPTAILHPNVMIGEGARVEPYVVLGSVTGEPLEIGSDAVIRSGTRIYGGVRIGDGLRTGHNALIRGAVVIGDDFHIGSYSSVEGTVWIDDRVKIQGRCEVADSFIHADARLWVQTIVCDNNRPPDGEKEPPTIGAGAHLYARVLVMPGANIGAGAVIAANAMVKGNIPPGALLTKSGKIIEQVSS